MLSTNDLDSSKFFRRKALNSVQVMEVSSSPRWRRLYYVQRTLMLPRRKEAAKGDRFVSVAPAVSK